jgi:hypothetical protein
VPAQGRRGLIRHDARGRLLLFKEAEKVQAQAKVHPLPSDVTPVLSSKEWQGATVFSSGEWMSTAQTILDWSWLPQSGPVAPFALV